MRETHAREPVSLRSVSRRETRKVAIGERENDNIARRLTEIAWLDHIVKRR